jgi:hypothetical protein
MAPRNHITDIFKWINTHDNDKDVCWEWLGAFSGRDERGYFTYEGVRRQAHHVTYELFEYPNGSIEKGMVHRHVCDHSWCCNPFHIEPGSQSDNERDKYRRDRAGYPVDVVKEILRWRKLGATAKTIAEHIHKTFGLQISESGIQKVSRGARRKEA